MSVLSSPPSSERFHGLDAVRAFALIAGVILHASMTYLPGAKYFWPMADTEQGVAAGILLPLLSGWLLVMTGIVAALVLTAYLKSGGHVPPAPANGPKFTPDNFPLTHLWFLYVLVFLYSITLVVRRLVKLVDPRDRLLTLIDRALPLLSRGWAVFAVAAPSTLALWLQPA